MIILSLLCILLYILYIIINYGIPHSLSATYYSIIHKVTFSLVLAVSAGLILPILLEITPISYQFLPFISIAGVLFVAAAPDYQGNNLTDYVHTTSAIVALIASQIWVYLISPWTLLFWIPLIIYVIWLWIKTKSIKTVFDKYPVKFWGEVIMLLTIYQILL